MNKAPFAVSVTLNKNPYHYLSDNDELLISGLSVREKHDKRFKVFFLQGDLDVELSNLCRRLESMVFSDFFGDHRELMQKEYAKYEAKSIFIAVVDLNLSRLAGVSRLLYGHNAQDFKIMHDLDPDASEMDIGSLHPGFSCQYTLEVATIAIAKEYRRKKFSSFGLGIVPFRVSVRDMLFLSIYKYSRKKDIRHWLMMLDDHVYRKLKIVRVNSEPLCGLDPVKYLGSELSHPLYIDVQKLVRMTRLSRPATYLALSKGVGINQLCDFSGISK